MTSKNSIKLDIGIVDKDEEVDFEGIPFSSICYVKLFVDGCDVISEDTFEGSFIYFKELKDSVEKSGKYLIFTSVSGIADDAGWDYVTVTHKEDTVEWSFERDNSSLFYLFDSSEYQNQISTLEDKIQSLQRRLILEPSHVIYPEEA